MDLVGQTLEIRELEIVVVTKNGAPGALNPDFLSLSGIVPAGWRVVGEPVTTPVLSQVCFDNGVTITAVPDRLVFFEDRPDSFKTKIGALAEKYFEAVPFVDCTAIGVNPRGHYRTGTPSEAQDFVRTRLLRGGLELEGVAATVAVKLTYALQDVRLTLDIEPASLTLDGQTWSVIMIAGNLHRQLDQASLSERRFAAAHIVTGIERDIGRYAEAAQAILVRTD